MPDVGTMIRQLSHFAEDTPQKVIELPDGMKLIVETIYRDAAAAEAVTMGGADAAAVGVAADAASALAGVSVVASMLPVAIFMQQCYNILYKITDKLPGPFGKLAKFTLFNYLPLATVIAQVADNIDNEIPHLMRNHQRVTRWASKQALLDAATGPVKPVNSATTHDLEKQYNALVTHMNYMQREIQQLQYALGIEQHQMQIPAVVTEQLRSLQGRVHALENTVTELQREININTATGASVQHQLEGLSSGLKQVRAETLSWVDVQKKLEEVVNATVSRANQTDAELHHQRQQIKQLSPLALLLSAGVTGLKTLRQLEDTPCMCPKFGNIPNELGTALALVEFIENG